MFRTIRSICSHTNMKPCFEQYILGKPWHANPAAWYVALKDMPGEHNRRVFQFCRVNCLDGCYHQKVAHVVNVVARNEREALRYMNE